MAVTDVYNEVLTVENWRIEQFMKQGFNDEQITELLKWDIDHHDTERLLSVGCQHDLSIEILRG